MIQSSAHLRVARGGTDTRVPPWLNSTERLTANAAAQANACYKMSSVKPVSSSSFKATASERLAEFLANTKASKPGDMLPLTPDASTREYFRVPWKKRNAVAAVYPEPFDPELHPYLDVTRLFLDAEIPVPEIYAVDGDSGIIVQEDLGDRQLFAFVRNAIEEECEEYKEQAINLIARIQRATEKAFEAKSICQPPRVRRSKALLGAGVFLSNTILTSLAKEDSAPR